MQRSVLFWVLMILWLLFGIVVAYRGGIWPMGPSFLLWVLLALLGWQVYGPAVKA